MSPHSFAGPDRGTGDAEEIRVHRVTGEDCPNPRCQYENQHVVVEWVGGDYDKRNSWISFDGSAVVDLRKTE